LAGAGRQRQALAGKGRRWQAGPKKYIGAFGGSSVLAVNRFGAQGRGAKLQIHFQLNNFRWLFSVNGGGGGEQGLDALP